MGRPHTSSKRESSRPSEKKSRLDVGMGARALPNFLRQFSIVSFRSFFSCVCSRIYICTYIHFRPPCLLGLPVCFLHVILKEACEAGFTHCSVPCVRSWTESNQERMRSSKGSPRDLQGLPLASLLCPFARVFRLRIFCMHIHI